MDTRFLAAFTFIALAGLGGCATSGPDSVEHAKDVNESIPLKVSDAASVFLVEMVDARLMDYEEGTLASERGTSPEVVNYGRLMVRDQTLLLKQLNALAAASRVTVPIVIGADKREGLDNLLAKNGEAFDKAFVRSIRIDHERDVAKFRKASALPDPAIAAYARNTLPTIEAHLDGIKQIDKAD